MSEAPELTMENLDATNREVAEKLGIKPCKTPRTAQIKASTRDAIKDVLARTGDAIEALIRERDAWRELAERKPVSQTPFPALALLAMGFAIGAAFGWLL